jgi:cytochrome c peroxidase
MGRDSVVWLSLVLGFSSPALAQWGTETPIQPQPTDPPVLGGQPKPVILPQAPAGNRLTVEKARLGRVLFWDEQLSSTRTVACGTCHAPEAGGADPRELHSRPGGVGEVCSEGVPRTRADGSYEPDPDTGLHPQLTSRRAPSVINAAYLPELLIDGRSGDALVDPATGEVVIGSGAALEAQALLTMLDPVEMGHEGRGWRDIVRRLEESNPLGVAASVPPSLEEYIGGRGYPELFDEAFGPGGVTPVRIAKAIASYERTLVSHRAPTDLAGGLEGLGSVIVEGRDLFFSDRTSCSECHGGPAGSDGEFHYTGVRPVDALPGRHAVTGDPSDMGAVRTPSLRNVGLRGPFFLDGRFETLPQVVDFYIRGGDHDAPHKDPRIRPLDLSLTEWIALTYYVQMGLTDPRVAAAEPPFDHPELFGGSAHVPVLFGEPSPGAEGLAPSMVALEPPAIGNPSWQVGVERAGGVLAVLAWGLGDVPSGIELGETTLHLDPAAPIWSMAVPLLGSMPGERYGSVPLPLPEDPGLVGASLFLQWFGIDPGAAGGFSATRAVQMTLYAGATSGV